MQSFLFFFSASPGPLNILCTCLQNEKCLKLLGSQADFHTFYLYSKLSFLFARQEAAASEEGQLSQTFLLQYHLTTVDHDLSALETDLFEILTSVKVNKGRYILSGSDNTSLISNSMITKRNYKIIYYLSKIYLEYQYIIWNYSTLER